MAQYDYKEHVINENKKINTSETLEVSSMDLDCSGAGMCQPEPVDAEISDIQPAYPTHKLEKAEEKAAHEVKEEEKQKAINAFESEENHGR